MIAAYLFTAFLAGTFYAQHDPWRVTAMVVVGLLLWALRDELVGRA
jgi:hypothetical protein